MYSQLAADLSVSKFSFILRLTNFIFKKVKLFCVEFRSGTSILNIYQLLQQLFHEIFLCPSHLAFLYSPV